MTQERAIIVHNTQLPRLELLWRLERTELLRELQGIAMEN